MPNTLMHVSPHKGIINVLITYYFISLVVLITKLAIVSKVSCFRTVSLLVFEGLYSLWCAFQEADRSFMLSLYIYSVLR